MTGPAVREATYQAPPNIALVKYWGVRDPALGLPFNSSLSVTLDRLRSRTTVRFDAGLTDDAVELNGVPAGPKERAAVVALLDRVRERAQLSWRARVRSENNFPTASGLASSASGFAALAGAASAAAGLGLSDRALSQLARFGSGSASRSIFGGFVEWRAGARPDGRDCYARELYPPGHWPELVDVVAMIEDAPQKEVRSSVAMQTSVRTSPEYARRIGDIPDRIARMRRAIRDRDPDALFPIVMDECDSFRTVCETTRPPLDYLTGASRAVLAEVRALNRAAGRPVAAYTHDAGAHVHVFTTRPHLRTVRGRIDATPGVGSTLLVRPGPGARALPSRGGRPR
ncbi:MAG TPA: diphosphomevalonate decarboxylase [Thermoplasmata archaeon]|nr:diphosphomevalonate decarboxylase [Thermoplasmata archaeon]